MIIEVESDTGNVVFPVPGVHNNAHSRVRIVDVHIPDPPLLAEYIEAVSNVQSFTIRETRNMYDLVDALDELKEGNDRLIQAYWNGTEFEIVAIFADLTLSEPFAAVLKLPETLLKNQVYSSCLNVAAIDISAGICVELFLGEMDGFYAGSERTSDAVRLKRGQSEAPVMWHFTRAPAMSGSVRVYSIDRATGMRRLMVLRSGERWSVRIELELTSHGFTRESAF